MSFHRGLKRFRRLPSPRVATAETSATCSACHRQICSGEEREISYWRLSVGDLCDRHTCLTCVARRAEAV